jgi:hypothetical protein
MALPYLQIRASAEAAIAEAGTTLTFISQSGVDVDPNRPWAGKTVSDTSKPVIGVILDYKDEEVDGVLIERGDRVVIVGSSEFDGEDMKDYARISDGVDEYEIIRYSEVKPATTSMIYKIQVRK